MIEREYKGYKIHPVLQESRSPEEGRFWQAGKFRLEKIGCLPDDAPLLFAMEHDFRSKKEAEEYLVQYARTIIDVMGL